MTLLKMIAWEVCRSMLALCLKHRLLKLKKSLGFVFTCSHQKEVIWKYDVLNCIQEFSVIMENLPDEARLAVLLHSKKVLGSTPEFACSPRLYKFSPGAPVSPTTKR